MGIGHYFVNLKGAVSGNWGEVYVALVLSPALLARNTREAACKRRREMQDVRDGGRRGTGSSYIKGASPHGLMHI